ncbi:TM2 domain-containing protein [Catellatospora sp. NPDC049111]|uniref:TM2 domain-containing protein n=1 Tax=Catellatospora sp. NPDC049111 TaxID=3155271 RepID=UPI0033DB60F8
MTYPPPADDPYRAADPYALPAAPPPAAPVSWGPSSAVQPYSGVPGGYGYGPPVSDKSKVVAGLLQMLPGFLLGLGGIGRLYAGHTTLGILQLGATLVGWASFWCGIFLILPLFIYAAVWLWFVIDGIILMAGNPVDGQGRPLRS